MTTYLTADALLASPEERGVPVDLPSGRGTVLVRGLSRDEAMRVPKAGAPENRDSLMISMGLVEPEMTPEQVTAWAAQPGSAGDCVAVSRQIAELSGMGEGAGKSSVARNGRKP